MPKILFTSWLLRQIEAIWLGGRCHVYLSTNRIILRSHSLWNYLISTYFIVCVWLEYGLVWRWVAVEGVNVSLTPIVEPIRYVSSIRQRITKYAELSISAPINAMNTKIVWAAWASCYVSKVFVPQRKRTIARHCVERMSSAQIARQAKQLV